MTDPPREASNVRCAGGGQWYQTWEDAEIGADRNVACGWTAYDLAATPTRLDSVRDEAVAATGTCPNCGGHLEPIPRRAVAASTRGRRPSGNTPVHEARGAANGANQQAAPQDTKGVSQMPQRRTWDDWEEHPPQPREVKRWLIWAGVILLILVPALFWVLNMLSRPAQIATRVTDPNRLIATYEGYYDKCTAVVAYDHNIADAKQAYDDARAQAAKDDPLGLKAQDVQQARTNLQGLQQRRREVAAEYNSQSLQVTRLNGLTKGHDLPARIEEGQVPQCGNGEVTAQ